MEKIKSRYFATLLLITSLSLGACQTIKQSDSDQPKFIPTNKWQPIFFGGHEVGRAKYEADYFDFEDGTQVYQVKVTEEVTYLDGKYRFVFVMEEDIKSITILRFSEDGKRFLLSDSYMINLDINAVVHTYYESDGESVRNRREIYNKRKVAYTQELFENTEDFIVSMYGSYVFRGGHYHRYKRWRSWGYELLKYDRI